MRRTSAAYAHASRGITYSGRPMLNNINIHKFHAAPCTDAFGWENLGIREEEKKISNVDVANNGSPDLDWHSGLSRAMIAAGGSFFAISTLLLELRQTRQMIALRSVRVDGAVSGFLAVGFAENIRWFYSISGSLLNNSRLHAVES